MILGGVCYSAIHFGRVILYVWRSPLIVSLLSDVYLGWYFRPETSINVSCISLQYYAITKKPFLSYFQDS